LGHFTQYRKNWVENGSFHEIMQVKLSFHKFMPKLDDFHALHMEVISHTWWQSWEFGAENIEILVPLDAWKSCFQQRKLRKIRFLDFEIYEK
jgi:hypothetical protein